MEVLGACDFQNNVKYKRDLQKAHICMERRHMTYRSSSRLYGIQDYKPLAKVYATQNLTPHISVTAEPILSKLETTNYYLKGAKLYLDPTSWVVRANTLFATIRVLSSFLFLGGFIVLRTGRTSVPILTIYTS